MTPAEKKAFFETKMTEQRALRDAKEAVIDKLVNGETLSDAEKSLSQPSKPNGLPQRKRERHAKPR